MIELDKNTQNNLIKNEVAIIYLYGSKKLKTQTALSDIDLGIVFKNPDFLKDPKATLKKYNELYNILSFVFKPSFKKELDIVFLQQASVCLQYQAISKGKIIFEALPEFTVNYEEKIINEYLDYKPILNYIDNIIIRRIA